MRVTSTTLLPLLVSTDDSRYGADHLLEDFAPGLAVESRVLRVDECQDNLARPVPGELVVGVPAGTS